jgi:hypothetical protein
MRKYREYGVMCGRRPRGKDFSVLSLRSGASHVSGTVSAALLQLWRIGDGTAIDPFVKI